ncbi:reverse transcriptase domain-containing protein, partial [Tanacetum coccineum]
AARTQQSTVEMHDADEEVARLYWSWLPDKFSEGTRVFIVDTMLATGIIFHCTKHTRAEDIEYNRPAQTIISGAGLAGELGRLLFISPIVSGADLLSLADYDPENKEVNSEESESENLIHDHIQGGDENAEDVQMADHLRSMEELLRIPIVGIENAIIVPAVLADEFELKTELLDFVSNNPFFGLENDDPHSHIRRFYQITRTLKLNKVPNDVVKLILFPFSLKGSAETWLENEPPCSITTWDDLVSKFLNRFYLHSKTRELRKEIMNFQQVFGETFTEAWKRFKDLLRKCPHHGFSLLHQIDFFYNGLCQFDQDSLNTTAGGKLMTRNTQEVLTIIENKARVRTCRNKPQVSSGGGTSTQIHAITALTKQVEALEYHFASMRETYDQNQETAVQLMQNQIGQMADFQKRPLGELSSNIRTNPLTELKVITNTDGLTLYGSFLSHSNLLVYQGKEQEPETITEVAELLALRAHHLIEDSYVEINTLLSHFNDSSPDYETFFFDIEEKSSGSTTSHSYHSLPDYDAFYFDNDHIKG